MTARTRRVQDVEKLMALNVSRATAEAALDAIGNVSDAREAIQAGFFANIDAPNDDDDDDDGTFEDAEGGDDSDVICTGDNGVDDANDSDVCYIGSGHPGSPVVDPLDLEFADQGGDDDDDDGVDLDPYAKLKLDKEYSATFVESTVTPRTCTLQGSQSPTSTCREFVCREITQPEWQKGVPHGGEQQFLFGDYQALATGHIACPQPHCSHKHERVWQDFLPLWPSVYAYLSYVKTKAAHACTKCGSTFCLACGQLVQTQASPTDKSKQKAKEPATTKSRAAETSSTQVEGSEDADAAAAAADNQETVALQALLHCPLLTSAVLGAGLAHVEEIMHLDADVPTTDHTAVAQDNGSSSTNPVTSSSGKKRKAEASSPVRSSNGNGGGVGYGGSSSDTQAWKAKAAQAQRQRDNCVARNLRALRCYLPDELREQVELPDGTHLATSPAQQDHNPPLSTLAHLRRRFLPIASSLLQTQSISDMVERQVLFRELLAWFVILSRHVDTAPLVAQRIMRVTHRELRAGKRGTDKVTSYIASPGPRELVHTAMVQAQDLLRNYERSKKLAEAAEAQKTGKLRSNSMRKDEEALLDFCRSVVQSVEAIDAGLLKTKGKRFVERLCRSFGAESSLPQDIAEIASEKALMQAYKDWAKGTIYGDADFSITSPSKSQSAASTDSEVRYQHVYDADIRRSRLLTNPRRNLVIAKELTGLRGDLPAQWSSSIFVRVDQSRLDVLKALIVGSPGTPYENGLFAFDIFLPETYKEAPPKMKIVTTGGGTCRFGPNLYHCGKVCLSLLGTWSGPGWSSTSTLLQVLISISSMILGEEQPITLEPGHERERDTPRSKSYNANLRRQTLKHAMLGMLRTPPAPWEDVVRGHFRLKRRAVTEQLGRWMGMDDGKQTLQDGMGYAYGGPAAAAAAAAAVFKTAPCGAEMVKHVAEMKEQLAKL